MLDFHDFQNSNRYVRKYLIATIGAYTVLFRKTRPLFLGVLAVTIISVNYFTHTSWYLWRWGSSQDYYAPCHDIEAIPIWQLKLPKLGSESNIRLVNITKDNHLDIVMGFGTGADG